MSRKGAKRQRFPLQTRHFATLRLCVTSFFPTDCQAMRIFLTLLLGVACTFAGPHPNIIVMMADDMGFSCISPYGGEIHTPNLQRLADEGLRFTQFYNNAKCTTTRASLLTGMYPRNSGNPIPRRIPTIGKGMRAPGY